MMRIGSVKSNYIFNMINVISGLFFPLITFPYVSRILLANGIGKVQFYTSIINYIIIITSIGIPMYAIREIAMVRDDKVQLSRTTIEILYLNIFLCLGGYFVVGILCFIVPEIQSNIKLFILLSSSILLTAIGCTWFYSGIEDFKYITIRGLVIKTISLVLLFLLVKDSSDILWYGFYTVFVVLGNNVLNFIRLRKYIHFEIRNIHPLRHLMPSVKVFIFNIVTSIYVNLDVVMLGFVCGVTFVGYYTAANKIAHIGLSIVTSLSVVMIPRLSYLIKNKEYDQFAELATKAYNLILMLGFPICIGINIFAETLISIFCGSSFEPSVPTLRILSPIIIAIGLSNLIGLQILYPQGKLKLVTLSTCVGAVINVVLNLVLMPVLLQDGAAIATIVAESSVVLVQWFVAGKFIPFSIFTKPVLKYLLSSIIMSIICIVLSAFIHSTILALIIAPTCGAVIYFLSLLLLKDEMALEIKAFMSGALKCIKL